MKTATRPEKRLDILLPQRKWLWIGVLCSICAHILVFSLLVETREQIEQAKHRIIFAPAPPGSFYKRPRSHTRILEFRKQPIPRDAYRKKVEITRSRVEDTQVVIAQRTNALLARLDARDLTRTALHRTDRLATGAASDDNSHIGLEIPALSSVKVQGTKESLNQVDMKLDLLRIEDMDTGIYHAMVIQDAQDRRSIKGFVHIAHAYPKGLPVNLSFGNMDFLIKALNEYTQIKADYLSSIALDDPELLKIPWLKMPPYLGWQVRHLADSEIENLGRYLANGGFALNRIGGLRTMEKMKGGWFELYRLALKSQGLNEGADWRFVHLKPSHPIYHSFFDFDMAVRDNSSQIEIGDMGLVIGDRLAVFLTTARSITTGEGAEGLEQASISVDGTRHLQFTVNTIVFALTQEGSLTQQHMSSIK